LNSTAEWTPHNREVRGHWGLDYTGILVNHGSYSATPLSVLAAQDDWRRRMEARPTQFMLRTLPQALRDAANAVGTAVGARGEDIVLIDNGTAGLNAVLQSFPLRAGDEILVTSQTYGALLFATGHAADRAGAELVQAQLPFPEASADAIVAAIVATLSPRTRLAIIDHIASPSGFVLPVQRIAAALHAHGVAILVDGAHAPGQVPLDIAALGVDYYVGNGHKWWMAPKGAAFLWVAPHRQEGLRPANISWGYGSGFRAEFEHAGTRDWSAALCLPDAIAFHRQLGGDALMRANAALAHDAAMRLATRLGTRAVALPDLQAAMTLVELPDVDGIGVDGAVKLRESWLEQGCDVPVIPLADTLWLRLSAQAYNLAEDYDRLGDLVEASLRRSAAA